MIHRIRHLCPRLILVLLVVPIVSQAHIVPPEEYHPIAESYRRIAFMVNLNPVPWDTVQHDAQVMTRELSSFAPEIAAAYEETVSGVFEQLHAERAVSLETPSLRKSSAKTLFEASTVAVSRGINAHLRLATKSLSNHESATQHVDVARQLFKSFEHEVKFSDARAYRKLGAAWLEASSAMGSPGILGVGAIPADVEVFSDATQQIAKYLEAAYGEGYNADSETWMQPVPYRSQSYDVAASIPVKLAPGSNLNKQLPRPRQILNMAARGVSELETPLIAMGDMAFDSPYIFGEPARSLGLSCNSCHNKGATNPNLFIAGLSDVGGGLDASNNFFAPHANNGHYDPVDVPDLRGIRFTAPYGRNGRFTSLREFTRNVIMNEFNGPEPDPVLMDSLIAYMNEFDFLPNEKLDSLGRLTEKASPGAKRGETLFSKPFEQLEGKSCATCHIPSNHFADGLRHDIGSAGGSSQYSLDRALETPTLLSALYTPPYMHNGSLATLDDVVAWFNTEHELELTNEEESDLIAYLEAIGGGEDAFEDTLYTLDAEMEEFSFFLSSYDYAKKLGKSDINSMIFQTIETEIEAHKWDIQDSSHLPKLDQMAGVMRDAYIENEQGNFGRVDELVTEYKTLYAKYVDVLK